MAKKEIDEVKEAGKMYREKTSLKGEMREAWTFIKQLTGVLFGLSIAGLGVYAVMQGLHTEHTLKHYAFIVSGSCAVVNGFYAMYYALRKVK